jgi:UDP-2,3-diacylglucosamine hydrolase
MQIAAGKKIYFLSDFHLGTPDRLTSLQREKYIIQFLESIRSQAAEIFIVGDLFDFWYEYRTVVPKGYVRILGKLAEMTDSGIPVQFFVGNHDMWMRGYFEQELNIPVYFEPQRIQINDKKFLVGHGDGLGPDDHGFKFMKQVFRNRFCQRLFALVHPSVGIGIANFFSRKSREKTGNEDFIFLGEDKEWLIIYSREVLAKEHIDYFIFGHRHCPVDHKLTDRSRYINLGDWIDKFTYAEFDGTDVSLKKWEG